MKIALTGGGTAGHAMVGSVLIPMLVEAEWKTIYIGSASGVEKQIIEKQGLAQYHSIPTGKLRRYFSLQNLVDPFKIIAGILKSYCILKKEAPHIIFSGGGYVSAPVVIAARALGIPVLLRETDYTVGLANRICLNFAASVNVTFPETAKQIRTVPVSNHGMIVKPALLQYSKNKDLSMLLSHYNVIHLCGTHNTVPAYDNLDNYRQLSFLEDMAAPYQAADYLLMRCGSNAICEGLVLGKQMICVPLTKSGSRGEQYDNAEFAVQNGNAVIVNELDLCGATILNAIKNLSKQPKNNTMVLTPLQLRQNCTSQIAQLHALALAKLHHDFIDNIYHGKNIDFFSLNSDELLYYNELAEEYGL